jgi:hypothetical protein
VCWGIECVGILAVSTDPSLPEGTIVAAVMGEMGAQVRQWLDDCTGTC